MFRITNLQYKLLLHLILVSFKMCSLIWSVYLTFKLSHHYSHWCICVVCKVVSNINLLFPNTLFFLESVQLVPSILAQSATGSLRCSLNLLMSITAYNEN